MTGLPEIVVEYEDTQRLAAEYERDLRKGRAFASGAGGVQERDLCALTLVHRDSGQRCELTAEAVYVQPDGPGVGVGVQFDQTDDDWLSKLDAFVVAARQRREALADDASGGSGIVANDQSHPLDGEEDDADVPGVLAGAEGAIEDHEDEHPADGAEMGEDGVGDDDDDRDVRDDADDADDDTSDDGTTLLRAAIEGREAKRTTNLFDRVRSLKPMEAQKLARQGTLPERVALERCFGGLVWEGLLQNAAITGQEVAKIAKKGSLPKPVISLIVNNSAWLQIPEVQRALLGNPRLGVGLIPRVLRHFSQAELRRLTRQTAYSHAVRAAAQKLIKKT